MNSTEALARGTVVVRAVEVVEALCSWKVPFPAPVPVSWLAFVVTKVSQPAQQSQGYSWWFWSFALPLKNKAVYLYVAAAALTSSV